MKYLFGLATIFFSVSSLTFAKGTTRYQYGLLTPDYGVVTEDDLAYDQSQQEIKPYDKGDILGSLHWQCVPVKNAAAKYRTWQLNGDNEKYCAPEVFVQRGGELHLYTDRRGHDIEFCQDFIHDWERITKNQNIVCLNGDGGGYNHDAKNGTYLMWTWEKIKTMAGCYSYFYGHCNTKGCAKGKCPQS